MRGMIIGLSALAITALPTLALADGDGAVTGAAGGAVAGAVVGGPVGAAVGGVAGGVIGGAASGPAPVVVAPGPGAARATRGPRRQQTTIPARASRDRRPIVRIRAGSDKRSGIALCEGKCALAPRRSSPRGEDCAKLPPQPVEFGSFVMAQGFTARVVGIAGADPLFARIRQEAEEAVRREPELALFLVRERSQPRYA